MGGAGERGMHGSEPVFHRALRRLRDPDLLWRDPNDSEFIDASRDGRDVFFSTFESLVPQDPDQVDLYDARMGGGFAPPVSPQECEGESCQATNPPPPLPPFTTQEVQGPWQPEAAEAL